jgi:acyl-CoA synthetase (AMP-forming)/AMP-acid ligase II/acyl carrier protein
VKKLNKINTISEIIIDQAKNYPDAKAIVAPNQKTITYSGLYRQMESVSVSLRSVGMRTDDAVAIVMPNGPEMASAFLCVSASATSAPLNPSFTFEEFDYYYSDLDVKAVILKKDDQSPARQVAEFRGIPTIDYDVDNYPTLRISENEIENSDFPVNPSYAGSEDTALLLHTSGTTSRPKIVPLEHRNLIASAKNIMETLYLINADTCLNVMPLYHIHGLMGVLLSSIMTGAAVVATSGFQTDKFFEWVHEYNTTWYSAVPTIHQQILIHANKFPEKIIGNKLRLIRSSSASMPPNVMKGLESIFNVPVIEAYGMTEASHQMTCNPMPPKHRKSGSVGLPTGQEVAIMAEDGQIMGFNEIGEIVIRGPNVTRGYLNNPEANEAAFSHGWFHTGDLGYQDEDGYFYISGRSKEIINRGGEKVFPREIDEVFLTHPEVSQAVTFAVKHPTLGEDAVTAIILGKGATIDQNDLREFAFERIADFKVPSQVIIVDEIPKGSTGKLQRIGLDEKLGKFLSFEYLEPRDDVEKKLVEMYASVLDRESIGVLDNFFMVGGDSLSAIQVVTEIHAEYGIELNPYVINRYPTIEKIADYLRRLLDT